MLRRDLAAGLRAGFWGEEAREMGCGYKKIEESDSNSSELLCATF